ncbi:YaaC family protein [Oceanobacillus bengalensis]|uniref:YaaC family protein n=1 Tax=Oceanobacillus bengalensis TaxID=1435466 RepID=A0A494YYI9_9BACI|nr:YaaC family protein [Oceanobacillus bengalensis]RKQ15243.1 hypothetical protein D8M05_10955 [Oceanobacillus bengalensis]
MSKSNEFYTYLISQQTAHKYLYHCYKQMKDIDAETKSYENSNKFMYYLDHGIRFYESGKSTDLFAKPVLFFYGMTHLLKAFLLTKRPDYPESTILLSHGVTARKRKKRNYTFLDDEVKIQQNGLFPYFSEHLFSKKTFPFEKITMEDLLSLIPEIDTIFSFHQKKKMVPVGSSESRMLHFPSYILDSHHLTGNAFVKKIEPYLPPIKDLDEDKLSLHLQLEESFVPKTDPFFLHLESKNIYFPIKRQHFLALSEIMVHYLILYNLSMVCRYEAEWWGDLLVSKPDIDFPLIVKFLNITAEKIPMMIQKELHHKLNEEIG